MEAQLKQNADKDKIPQRNEKKGQVREHILIYFSLHNKSKNNRNKRNKRRYTGVSIASVGSAVPPVGVLYVYMDKL